MRKSLKSASVIAALLAVPVSAMAHAYPAHETPPSGAVLKLLPGEVSINFTETVNRHFSGIVVQGPNGKQVSHGEATLERDNPKTLIIHLRRSNRAGRYTVLWHALASDGHRTHGRYSFQVTP
ncbi:copper resistance protein CopC [Acidiphilium multivorum]|jgi:hypothetical protein|uniref:copper resistance CopC family protein n=1 Tax=Acidiphilium multivorum TaxID=62140 RepID=UPI0039C9A282